MCTILYHISGSYHVRSSSDPDQAALLHVKRGSVEIINWTSHVTGLTHY